MQEIERIERKSCRFRFIYAEDFLFIIEEERVKFNISQINTNFIDFLNTWQLINKSSIIQDAFSRAVDNMSEEIHMFRGKLFFQKFLALEKLYLIRYHNILLAFNKDFFAVGPISKTNDMMQNLEDSMDLCFKNGVHYRKLRSLYE